MTAEVGRFICWLNGRCEPRHLVGGRKLLAGEKGFGSRVPPLALAAGAALALLAVLVLAVRKYRAPKMQQPKAAAHSASPAGQLGEDSNV